MVVDKSVKSKLLIFGETLMKAQRFMKAEALSREETKLAVLDPLKFWLSPVQQQPL